MKLGVGQDNFVWGKDNPAGLHLDIVHGDGWAETHWKATGNYVGYDNIIHGGIMATILDDMMGPPAIYMNVQVVTAHLEMDYRTPAHVGDELDFRTWIVEYGGRKSIKMAGQVKRGDTVIAEAKSVMVIVGSWDEEELAELEKQKRISGDAK